MGADMVPGDSERSPGPYPGRKLERRGRIALPRLSCGLIELLDKTCRERGGTHEEGRSFRGRDGSRGGVVVGGGRSRQEARGAQDGGVFREDGNGHARRNEVGRRAPDLLGGRQARRPRGKSLRDRVLHGRAQDARRLQDHAALASGNRTRTAIRASSTPAWATRWTSGAKTFCRAASPDPAENASLRVRRETVVQSRPAPFKLTYVNAADDPSGMQGEEAAANRREARVTSLSRLLPGNTRSQRFSPGAFAERASNPAAPFVPERDDRSTRLARSRGWRTPGTPQRAAGRLPRGTCAGRGRNSEEQRAEHAARRGGPENPSPAPAILHNPPGRRSARYFGAARRAPCARRFSALTRVRDHAIHADEREDVPSAAKRASSVS